jgi:hypothetical protein
MKKLGQVLLVLVVVSAVLSSCKSHDTCPAYSIVDDVEQADKNI